MQAGPFFPQPLRRLCLSPLLSHRSPPHLSSRSALDKRTSDSTGSVTRRDSSQPAAAAMRCVKQPASHAAVAKPPRTCRAYAAVGQRTVLVHRVPTSLSACVSPRQRFGGASLSPFSKPRTPVHLQRSLVKMNFKVTSADTVFQAPAAPAVVSAGQGEFARGAGVRGRPGGAVTFEHPRQLCPPVQLGALPACEALA